MEAGYNVIGVNEAATEIITQLGGSIPAGYDPVALQHAILEAGVHGEKTALRLADLSISNLRILSKYFLSALWFQFCAFYQNNFLSTLWCQTFFFNVFLIVLTNR
eukprot:SAG11_NODE_3529_length_2389_cov_19.404803_3_plen_105_part_00